MTTIKEIYTLYKKHFKVDTDTRTIRKNTLFFALKGTNFNGNKYTSEALKKGADYAIIDDAKYKIENCILVDDVLETLQQLATYHRKELNIPIVSLTGSNGKTTTKELIKTVLSTKYNVTATKGNLNNHIGVPLTLLSMTPQTEIGIVEMGANHPKEIAFLCNIAQPNFGTITNFGKAHLEGFGSLEGVVKAKTELYHYLKKNKQLVFVNSDDEKQVLESKDMRIISFGSKDQNTQIIFIEANPFVHISYDGKRIKSNLVGNYNFNNIATAIAIGKHFKVPTKKSIEAIEGYTPSSNRSQIVIKKDNKIILDAYNANPSSMEVALENFSKQKDKNKIVILGDMFELGKFAAKEHQMIADLATKFDFKKIILIGENFFGTKNTSVEKYKNFENFKADFNSETLKNHTLLIKGSRGMALERILDML